MISLSFLKSIRLRLIQRSLFTWAEEEQTGREDGKISNPAQKQSTLHWLPQVYCLCLQPNCFANFYTSLHWHPSYTSLHPTPSALPHCSLSFTEMKLGGKTELSSNKICIIYTGNPFLLSRLPWNSPPFRLHCAFFMSTTFFNVCPPINVHVSLCSQQSYYISQCLTTHAFSFKETFPSNVQSCLYLGSGKCWANYKVRAQVQKNIFMWNVLRQL